MRFRRLDQIHVAIYTGAGIIAGVGVTAMVGTYSYHILTRLKIRGEVIHERCVSVGTVSKMMTVDVDITTVVDPFEIEIGFPAGIRGCVIEMLAIPAYTSGKIARSTGKVG
jgi:hypothetical protein